MRRPARMSLAIVGAIALVMAACGDGDGEGAAAEGGEGAQDDSDLSLVVYSPLAEFEIARLVQTFEQETGIDTDFLRLGSGEIVARVIAEGGNPAADVYVGGPSENHEALLNEGLLRAYESPVAIEEYDEEFYHPEHYWHGFYVQAQGLGINTELWEEQFGDDPYPETWDDLLDERYEGQLVVANPASSGAAYHFLATQVFRLGEPEVWDWWEDFDRTVNQYPTSGTAPGRLVGAGEYLFGISFGHDLLKPQQAGYPIDVVYPQETGRSIGAVSIIDNGPNPTAAERFVDWMLGQEAGQIHTDLSLRISVRDDVAVPDGVPLLDGVSFVDFDAEWAGENNERLSSEWNDRVGG
jgi:iron(III) transport system substrate-binding protein